jgi:hypothetical protein
LKLNEERESRKAEKKKKNVRENIGHEEDQKCQLIGWMMSDILTAALVP